MPNTSHKYVLRSYEVAVRENKVSFLNRESECEVTVETGVIERAVALEDTFFYQHRDSEEIFAICNPYERAVCVEAVRGRLLNKIDSYVLVCSERVSLYRIEVGQKLEDILADERQTGYEVVEKIDTAYEMPLYTLLYGNDDAVILVYCGVTHVLKTDGSAHIKEARIDDPDICRELQEQQYEIETYLGHKYVLTQRNMLFGQYVRKRRCVKKVDENADRELFRLLFMYLEEHEKADLFEIYYSRMGNDLPEHNYILQKIQTGSEELRKIGLFMVTCYYIGIDIASYYWTLVEASMRWGEKDFHLFFLYLEIFGNSGDGGHSREEVFAKHVQDHGLLTDTGKRFFAYSEDIAECIRRLCGTAMKETPYCIIQQDIDSMRTNLEIAQTCKEHVLPGSVVGGGEHMGIGAYVGAMLRKVFSNDNRGEELFFLIDSQKAYMQDFSMRRQENYKNVFYLLFAGSAIGKSILMFGGTRKRRRNVPCGREKNAYAAMDADQVSKKNGRYTFVHWIDLHETINEWIGHAFIDFDINAKIEAEIEAQQDGADRLRFSLSGMVFAFGLQGRLADLPEATLLSLFIQNDQILTACSLLGASLSMVGTGNIRLGALAKYHLLRSDNNPTIDMACYMSIGLVYAQTGDIEVTDLLLRSLENNMGWRNNTYRQMHNEEIYYTTIAFAVGMVRSGTTCHHYIPASLRTAELIMNGCALIASDRKDMLFKFRHQKTSLPEEIYYSVLFSKLISMGDMEIPLFPPLEDMLEVYRTAGAVMYYGIKHIGSGAADALIAFTLQLENNKKKSHATRILFRNCIVALSLICNSTGNIDVLRIIRRQMREENDDIENSPGTTVVFGHNVVTNPFCAKYREIYVYRICLGLLFAGYGMYSLKNDRMSVIYLLVTFYFNFPGTLFDQDIFQLFRYFAIKGLRQKMFFVGSDIVIDINTLTQDGIRRKQQECESDQTRTTLHLLMKQVESGNITPEKLLYEEYGFSFLRTIYMAKVQQVQNFEHLLVMAERTNFYCALLFVNILSSYYEKHISSYKLDAVRKKKIQQYMMLSARKHSEVFLILFF